MTDVKEALAALRRPPMLVRAARFGATDYSRERDLRRLLGTHVPPAPEQAITRLLRQEARIEETRRSGAVSYSAARHVELLAAVMAEARAVLT